MATQAGSFEQSLKADYAAVQARLRGRPRPRYRKIIIEDLTPEPVAVAITVIDRPLDAVPLPAYIPTVARILEVVAAFHNLRVIDILAQRRTSDIVEPRHIVFYLASTMTMTSLPHIGRVCAGRDHTTVLHGIRKIQGRRPNEPELDALLTRLEELLSIDPRIATP